VDNFLSLLDLFSGEIQIEVNKSVLAAFARGQETINDPILINSLFTVGKGIHDSINALSFFDEVRQISRLISAFISKVDFGIDLERHLNFFVECRRAFINLDAVKEQLSLGACHLAMKTLRIIKGKHSKKTAAFVRGCIAYCFITIPSMEDPLIRLNLYLLSGQVALLNQALPQADSLFKAAIKLVQEVPARIDSDSKHKSTEEPLVEFLTNFLSELVVVPGSPEQGPFYLVKGLLKVISEYPWEKGSTAKARLYINMLNLFAVCSQQKFPFHLANVESNDTLYANDPEYIDELQTIINKLLEMIQEEITLFKGDPQTQKLKSKLSLDLLNTTLAFAELNARSATLIVQLYTLCKEAEPYYIKNSINYLRSKEGNLANELYKKIQTISFE